MAAGMPIVASSIPGVSEVLENGVEGLLVPADSPGELAAALSSLLSNETRALGLGYAAWMRVRRDYSIGRYRDELIEVYENALGHRAPRLSH
jgi:glycosyltransferase involved in cell wall biosynthesis